MKSFIKQSLLLLLSFYAFMRRGKVYKFKYKDTYKGETAYILCNGPSLKRALVDYDEGKELFNNNSFMVNMGALDENHFFKIKPKHYCFSDPIFFRDYEPKKEAIMKMYNIFEKKVDWDMNIYTCFADNKGNEIIKEYSKITNPHIHFVPINKVYCQNLKPSLRHKLYNSGYFMPIEGSIVSTAIYVALLEGYSTIYLYGVDHNQFLDLAVNDNNQLCSVDRHFYDNDEPVLKPFLDTSRTDGGVFRVHDFFRFLSEMFTSHEYLSQFAKFKGARIINCTKGSMIDSYERR